MTLLRLDVSCPRCGTAPNIRITPQTRGRWADEAPETLVNTWHCQNCGEPVQVRAVAYQRAYEAENGEAA